MYSFPTSSSPVISCIITGSLKYLGIASFARMYWIPFSSTTAYVMSFPTASAMLLGVVHGVVVHPSRYCSFSLSLNFVVTVSSVTSLYPNATSWLLMGVSHLGQYGTTLCSSYSSPFWYNSFRLHHTLSMYSFVRVTYGFSMSIQNAILFVRLFQSFMNVNISFLHSSLNFPMP